MIQRKILTSLNEWRMSDRRKPLVLRGARQVGKSTAVDAFGASYANYLSFNLEETRYRELFEMDIPLEDLMVNLFAAKGLGHNEGETLIFIDEIQNSPMAMAKLRYFKERLPQIHVIAAGSLLENIVDVKASFPVGRVDFMAMRPCSFFEFMDGMGHGEWMHFIQNPEHSHPMHSSLMSLFNQYTIVGGMPEVVNDFIENRDIVGLEPICESLIQGYKDDVEKYVKGKKIAEVVKVIIERGWSTVGEKITLNNFAGTEYKAREVGEACRLLNKSMLLELAYPTSSTMVPSLPELGRKPKLLMLDSGLANYKAGVRQELIGAPDILGVWKGRMAEQIVGQELLTLNNKVSQTRSFWSKIKDEAEVDFVWTWSSQLIPIEVKNGHNSHLKSLHSFMETAPTDVAIRVWSQPFSVNEVQTPIKKRRFKLINLPFYMIGNLESILAKYS